MSVAAYLVPRILQFTIMLEGGLVNAAHDAGGLTKYGISQARYPDLDIAALRAEDAQDIYLRDFWTPFHYDLLTPGLAQTVFDFGVTSGPEDAIKAMQRCLHVKDDGVIGEKTAFAAAFDNNALMRFSAQRAQHYFSLDDYKFFGDDWTLRCFECFRQGLLLDGGRIDA